MEENEFSRRRQEVNQVVDELKEKAKGARSLAGFVVNGSDLLDSRKVFVLGVQHAKVNTKVDELKEHNNLIEQLDELSEETKEEIKEASNQAYQKVTGVSKDVTVYRIVNEPIHIGESCFLDSDYAERYLKENITDFGNYKVESIQLYKSDLVLPKKVWTLVMGSWFKKNIPVLEVIYSPKALREAVPTLEEFFRNGNKS